LTRLSIPKMKSRGYLLDTHVLVWLGRDPKRFGKNCKRILERSNLYYTSISVAELALKSKLGKREFNTAVIEEWKQARIEPATFDDASALNFANLSSEWLPDPFDRQIVAIAMSNQFELITADQRILELGYDWIVDATA